MYLHHICITTPFYKESLEFYTSILDMVVICETKDFHNRDYNTWLKGNGIMIELQTGKKDQSLKMFDKESSGISHICFMVEDINKIYDKIINIGFVGFLKKDNKDIYEVCGTRIFKISAPEGTIIEFRDKEI